MAQRHAEQLGRALAGTYLLDRLLGVGGMGAVYAARHLRTGGLVAVKMLDRDAATDEEIYRRFQNEARIVSALRHPHIVQVIDFDEDDDGTPFMVMELLEGEDLHRRLRRVGRLPLGPALELARQVGGALHAAHQLGVIHRDVKPQNVFLCRHPLGDEIVEVAKVVDFGISKIRDVASQTQDKMVLGTPYYMSPEAARAQNTDLDGRADQWGLAVILYRALSGRLPFENPDPLAVLYQVVNEQPRPLTELVSDLPPHVGRAVMRAMSKNREDRFPTMMDFVHALEAGPAQVELDYEAIEVAAEPPAPPSAARPWYRWAVLLTVLVVLMSMATTAALLAHRTRGTPPLARPSAPLPQVTPPPVQVDPLPTAHPPAAPSAPPPALRAPASPAAEPRRERPRTRRRNESERADPALDKDI
ncbi:MAG: serine/threonine-protein kinase [Myxococcales bacterium]|nr:serine/threonine protein kinase [Myxococcota bacterium]MDW8280849.1 serine/threonine-protein kinase [Myxococcales bacterium]